ncbi:hypothetical protein J2Z84_005022 [Agrobacterium rubi]|nr:hypothetical protein [Agrobacterium rubi]
MSRIRNRYRNCYSCYSRHNACHHGTLGNLQPRSLNDALLEVLCIEPREYPFQSRVQLSLMVVRGCDLP